MTTSGLTRPPRVTTAAPRLAARAAAVRKDRRRRLLRRGVVALAVLLPIAFAGWLLAGSSLFALQRVVVSGESRLTVQQVQAAAAVPVGTALVRVDTAAVSARVRTLAPVASVRVERRWPHVLRIVVVERVVVAATLSGSSVHLVDATGAVVGDARAVPRGLPALHVPADGGASARAALTVLKALPPALRSQLAGVTAETADAVQLDLRDGRRVLWGSAGPPVQDAQKAAAVGALLQLPGRTFDVSAPGIATRR